MVGASRLSHRTVLDFLAKERRDAESAEGWRYNN
jgi:hypothetical protein